MSTVECSVWWAILLPSITASRYVPVLDEHETERYNHYQDDVGKRRFLSGRALAKHAVGQRLGRDASEIIFDSSCPDCGKLHGPPRIPGSSSRLSISHSGDRVGVAVVDDVAVGLDVESTQRQVTDSLVSYALNPTEKSAFDRLNSSHKESAFFTYWTRKEALMKSGWHGLRIPLQSLTVSGADEPARLEYSTDARIDPSDIQLADLTPGDGYRAAVALGSTQQIDIVERWWKP